MMNNRSLAAYLQILTIFAVIPLPLGAIAQEKTLHTAEEYLQRGNSFMAQGKVDKAISDFDAAIKINPTLAAAYYSRGLARQADLRMTVKAVDLRDPQSFKESILKQLQNRSDQAIADFSKAIKLNPNFADAYFQRGVAREGKGDDGGALQDYSKAIEINPRFANAYYNRGILRQKKRDFKGAIADFDKAIEIAPNDSKFYSNRGVAKHSMYDFQGAIADFNKAIMLAPDDPLAWANRANSRTQTGDYSEALADYDKALLLDPKQAGFYAGRGLLNRSGISSIVIRKIGCLVSGQYKDQGVC